MVAPVTLSLHPCATLAPSRSALPHTHAGVAPAGSRPPHAVAVSYRPTRLLGSLHRAVAVDSDLQGSSELPDHLRRRRCLGAQEEKPKSYYFLVANAKFMLDEEKQFQEQLTGKLCNYGERDFWLLIEPKFLDRFPNITKRPAVAIVSTDGN